MRTIWNKLMRMLAPSIQKLLLEIPISQISTIEEIRMRKGQPLMLYAVDRSYFVTEDGWLTNVGGKCKVVQEADILTTFDLLTGASVYAKQDQIKQGFLTIEGGHRVGIAGTTVLKQGEITHIKEISGLNIRVARQVMGVADKVMVHIKQEERILNTLILSPPGYGKTTLLRDIARQLGDGSRGIKVGIVDERSEIAACVNGIPSFQVGVQTDVLDRCPKCEGLKMMVRTLSPNVVITDEIGGADDLQALREVLSSGVSVITTAHAGSLAELKRRPMMQAILKEHIFDCFIVLHKDRNGYQILMDGVE
ncbi:MAG: stage III sporulation protein AA [Hyphomonadaceae bacterium]|nr:stage III sporulation protein AA [Clostridia bacterium]